MSQQPDYYTPAPQPTHYYGYQPGFTYMINGYRMYLHGGYWYFVDYPHVPPLRAGRPHYRTGGGLGIFFKIMGTLLFLTGIGAMMVDDTASMIIGAFFAAFGIFGFGLAIADSMRNHPGAWKVGATVAAGAIVAHQVHKRINGGSRQDRG
jgi:hypothetical protein